MRILKKLALLCCICLILTSGVSVKAEEVIDVTNLGSESVGHDCNNYLVSKYDTTNHWKECSVCGEKYDISEHTYTEYWTLGDSCSISNKLVHSCDCGYSFRTDNTREHDYVDGSALGGHSKTCRVCREQTALERHIDENGNQLMCCSNQRCAKCGYLMDRHCDIGYSYNTKSGKWSGETEKCRFCGKEYLNLSDVIVDYSENNGTFTLKMSIPLKEEDFPANSTKYKSNWSSKGKLESITSNATFTSNGDGTVTCEIIETGTYNKDTESICNYCHILYNSKEFFDLHIAYIPDIENPEIVGVEQQNLSESNGWTTKRQFTVSGNENFCKSVNVQVKDSSNKSIATGTVKVDNGKWNYSFTPNIEVKGTQTFTVVATDSFGNSLSYKFNTSNIDGVSPVVSSKSNLGMDWSKTKDFNVSCIDSGSGGVQVALADLGYTDEKSYIFTGDVYGDKELSVVYKDLAGNITQSNVIVSNLDNTKPTITKVSSTSEDGTGVGIISIEANDRHKTFGEGSGVKQYGVSRSETEQPTEWSDNKNVSVTDNGVYYVWVKDLVGNISKPSKIDVSINSIVTFNPEGGVYNKDKCIYAYGSKYSGFPKPEKKGYTFLGWYTEQGNDIADGDDVIKQGNIQLYARYEMNPITITVPKNLIVGDDGKCTFKIEADNDVGIVTVNSDSNVILSQEGKGNIVGSIILKDNNIDGSEEGITGIISCKDLLAGSWEGEFAININYSE